MSALAVETSPSYTSLSTRVDNGSNVDDASFPSDGLRLSSGVETKRGLQRGFF